MTERTHEIVMARCGAACELDRDAWSVRGHEGAFPSHANGEALPADYCFALTPV
jgi:hypothetical protein